MLHLITSPADKFFNYIADDPVRPTISKATRLGDNRDIFVSCDDDGNVQAITCVSYQSTVPTVESELFDCSGPATVAVFYTIWSYKPGAGRRLIFEGVDHIKHNRSNIQRFVTLSPKTDMARVFHLRNGACVFRENTETVNYEYLK